MLVFFRSCSLTAFRQAASVFPAYCSKAPGHEPDALRQRHNAQEAARNSALRSLAMRPMSTLPRKRDAPLKNKAVESESRPAFPHHHLGLQWQNHCPHETPR